MSKSYFFFPPAKIVSQLNDVGTRTIRELCSLAEIPCRASGRWTERKVMIKEGDNLEIEREPGSGGTVKIKLKTKSRKDAARKALIVMAYGVNDPVARASLAGLEWTRISNPMGRPQTGKALTTAERQSLFRQRKKKDLKRTSKKA